jgi:CRISPR-associated protein Cas6
MFWQEDTDQTEALDADAVVDVLFSLQCRSLPVDHAHALSTALLELAPWLGEEPFAAVHTIHVAGSQNGWERPAHGGDQQLLLSRRTKLSIRVPRPRVGELAAALEGQTLDIAGSPLTIGSGKERPLSRDGTLFARYVVLPGEAAGDDEDAFLTWAAAELSALDIKVRKALCGKTTPLATPDGALATRSLMLASLTPDESIRLQQHGLGPHRTMGCGVFIPHKGIDAVKKASG